MSNKRFSAGDRIEVRWLPGAAAGPDFGRVRGTALEDRGFTGAADFTVEVFGTEMRFNLNHVEVEVLDRVKEFKLPDAARENLAVAKSRIWQALEAKSVSEFHTHLDIASGYISKAQDVL